MAEQLPLAEILANRVNPPRFFVGNGVFAFHPGDRPAIGDDLVGPRQHPFLIPLSRVAQIEDLRRFIAQQPDRAPQMWAGYLDAALGVVEQKSLPLLRQPLSPDAMQEALSAADSEAVAKIIDGAQMFARSRQLTYQRATTLQLVRHVTEVSFSVVPAGGSVSLIPSTFYTTDDRFAYMWVEISTSDRPKLGGTYYYKAAWPDGRRIDPTQLPPIEREGQSFTITPK